GASRPAHRQSPGGGQRRGAQALEPRPARAGRAAGRLDDRSQPAHRGGGLRKAPPGVRRLIRLAVRVRREQAELVLAELLELAPSGVEEATLSSDVVEYAVYGSPGELPSLPDLQAAAGGALVEVSTSEVADDWAQRWREFHKPLVLDGRLTVRPPAEPRCTT